MRIIASDLGFTGGPVAPLLAGCGFYSLSDLLYPNGFMRPVAMHLRDTLSRDGG